MKNVSGHLSNALVPNLSGVPGNNWMMFEEALIFYWSRDVTVVQYQEF